MTGYEFTRFEADYTCKTKATAYDAREVAFQLNRNKVNLRGDADYQDAKDWFIETKMSCNKGERIAWMEYYMANAIAYGIETKNKDWRTKFLAAWDIFHDITLR